MDSCPSNLHTVVWSQSESPILIRIFKESSAAYFKPYLKNLDLNYLPHNVFYAKNGFEEDNLPLPSFQEATFQIGDFIFVPKGHVYSVRKQPESVPNDLSQTTETSTVFKLCFLDASNYQSYLSSLEMEAMVCEFARELLSRLKGPHFNTTMDRDPEEYSVDDFQKYPRVQVSPLDIAKADGKDEVSTLTDKTKKPIKLKRGGGKAGGGGGSAFRGTN